MIEQDAPTTLGPELDFLRAIWAFDHEVQKCSKRMARDLGVTGPQRLALRIVARFPGIPAGRLARILHLHPSTLTGVVKRLAERGLIARRHDRPDRRRALLQITPAGVSLLGREQETVESAVRATLRTLSPREIEAAIKALTVLALGLNPAQGTVSPTAGRR